MAIFGAGASYDSSMDHVAIAFDRHMRDVKGGSNPEHSRMPLAVELFDDRFGDLVAEHPDAQPIIGRVRRAVANGAPLEQELEAVAEEAGRYPHIPRQFLALRYYLQAIVQRSQDWWHQQTRGITNYQVVVDEAARWSHDTGKRVSFVTFNYDRLLEEAVRAVLGTSMDELADYVQVGRPHVHKVHGSVDWVRQIDGVPGNHQGAVLASASELSWTDSYSSTRTGPPEAAGRAWVPAIAVPTVSKSGFECPPSHIDVLKQSLPEVSHLLVVGWRGAEEHFLKLWSDTSAGKVEKLHIVDGNAEGCNAVRTNLHKLAGVDEAVGSETTDGFSAFIRSGGMRDFLA